MRVITKPFGRMAAGLGWRARALSRRLREARAAIEARLRQATGLTEPEEKLIGDAQTFWNNPSSRTYAQDSHWRGGGRFADESKWLAMGREHLDFFRSCARLVKVRQPMARIVEWGCGGGMNAIHFAPLAAEFCVSTSQPRALRNAPGR